MKTWLQAGAIALASLSIGAAQAAQTSPAPPHVRIFSCQVISGGTLLPQSDEIGLAVRFQNEAPQELASIVWRANYGKHPVDFIDDGTFSPSVQIDNYVLYERGSAHFNWMGAAGDILAVVAHTVPNQSLTAANISFPVYLGTEDPQNCSIVRTVSVNGDVWRNPDMPQSVDLIPTPTPKSSPSQTPIPSPSAAPVDIQQCALEITGKGFLSVKFRSRSPLTADRIVFRAPYANTGIDFVDVGTYSQAGLITHLLKLALPEELKDRQFIGFDDPSSCAIVSVHYLDGTLWKNPTVSETPAPLPTPVANGLKLGGRMKWSQRHTMPTPVPSPSPTSGT